MGVPTSGSEPDPVAAALEQHLYWAQEPGRRHEAGTKQVREELLEFVAQMRTDERLSIPLGETHLDAPTPLRRKVKYTVFRAGRFGTRRYDRLLGDAGELMVQLAQRVIDLEHDVAELRERLETSEQADDRP